MFGNDRNAIRQQFISAWKLYRIPGAQLTPLQQMIGDIIAMHQEYHPLFEQEDEKLVESEFGADGGPNPFFHLGMHISLHEQLQTDRPAGIRKIFQSLQKKSPDSHHAEHRMMECLEKSLWEAQAKGVLPDEKAYLECLMKLPGK
jgi:hypothetical protein